MSKEIIEDFEQEMYQDGFRDGYTQAMSEAFRWFPADEQKPDNHEMVILTGIEAINNKRIYAIKCWDVDRWRPDNSAPSIYWDYWHKLPVPPEG